MPLHVGTVTAKVTVQPKVAVGLSTVAGGGVTLAAFALALVAFLQGERDEATISALVVGTVSLVTTLGGRYAQAVAALLPRAGAPATVVNALHPADPAALSAVADAAGRRGDEPGDSDALPEYATAANVPPDTGDSAP